MMDKFLEGFEKAAFNISGITSILKGVGPEAANLAKLRHAKEMARVGTLASSAAQRTAALGEKVKSLGTHAEKLKGIEKAHPIKKFIPFTEAREARSLRKGVEKKLRHTKEELAGHSVYSKELQSQKADIPIMKAEHAANLERGASGTMLARGGAVVGGLGAYSLAKDYMRGNRGSGEKKVIVT